MVRKATLIITRNVNTSIKKYCHHEISAPGLLIVSSELGCRIKYSIHQTARSTGCIGWSITKSCKWLMAAWYLNEEHYNLQKFKSRESFGNIYSSIVFANERIDRMLNTHLFLSSFKTVWIPDKKVSLDKPFHGRTCAIPRFSASNRLVFWSFDNGIPNNGFLHINICNLKIL